MGAAASVNKEFAKDMKNKGFKEQILKAKTDDEKIRVFNALQEEVRLYFAATQIQAAARKKLANQSLSGGSLHEIFLKFCRFGKGQSNTTELDGKRWAKFCKENKFYTINKKAFNATGADMVFAKVRALFDLHAVGVWWCMRWHFHDLFAPNVRVQVCRKAKFMSFNQFKDEALPEVASRCGVCVPATHVSVSRTRQLCHV